jgi:hypothetical protein
LEDRLFSITFQEEVKESRYFEVEPMVCLCVFVSHSRGIVETAETGMTLLILQLKAERRKKAERSY